MRQIIAVADDLSGAAETAAKMLERNAHTTQQTRGTGGIPAPSAACPRVALLPSGTAGGGNHPSLGAAVKAALLAAPREQPVVLDSDNRRFHDEEAGGRLREILAAITSLQETPAAGPPLVFLKIDSLLRGPLAGQVAILAGSGPVILAPALPELGRSTVQGVVRVEGRPLDQTDLWHAEGKAAPGTVAQALSSGGEVPLASGLVGLGAVRGDPAALEAELRAQASRAAVVICDAETSADLDAIVRAAAGIEAVRFAGSSALGAALWRNAAKSGCAPVLAAVAPASPGTGSGPGRDQPDSGFPLLVIGSASPQSREQLQVLAGSGVAVFAFGPSEILDGSTGTAPVREALATGPVAVTVDTGVVDPARSAGITAALTRLVVPLAGDRPLMLTGGETARAVLDALGVRHLDVLAEVEHGAVLSRTDRGRPVVTRPGSFGGPGSLRLIGERLTSSSYPATSPSIDGTVAVPHS